ncbi:unnamed protein product [Echinostoma caproni]|uniref:MFS domain-containing protein n=1 Tax=Echinostoma caproni TaxID=27848 RepID=A0A183B0Y5_9TREM|nr:unnamed protein product [Echinostoma caproni]
MACVASKNEQHTSDSADPGDPRNISVDSLLENLVNPCGLSQWLLALLLMLSTSSLATFPVYGNSASPHRCRMEPAVELFAHHNNLTFDQIASRIGPWHGQNTTVHSLQFGCMRYKRNWTEMKLSPVLLANLSTHIEYTTEPCPFGYVHQQSAYHYPQSVVVEFSTVCEHSWLTPFGTSIYMIGMLFGFILGGWSGDRFGRRPTIMAASMLELLTGVWTVLAPNYTNYVLARGLMAVGNTAKINAATCRINHWWRNTSEVKQLRTLWTEEVELQKLSKPMMTASGNILKPRRGFNFLKPLSSPKVARCTLLCVGSMLGLVMGFFGLLLYARILSSYVYLVGFLNALTAIPANILSAVLYRYCLRRKRPLIALTGLAAIVLAASSLYTLIMQPKADLVMTVCSNIALVLVNASVCMCYVYVPELFPSEIRTHAFGLVLGLARIGSIVCTFVNELDRIVAHGVPMLIYAAVFLCVLVTLALLEDTSGENLPDVSQEKC